MSKKNTPLPGLLKCGAVGLGAFFWLVNPQENMQSQALAADNIDAITLTKVVDIEGQSSRAKPYQVAPGDSLNKILKTQKLINPNDQDSLKKLLQAVKELNPELKDLNILQPGQTIMLPEQRESFQSDPLGQLEDKTPQTIKIYQRRQEGQKPANVVVKTGSGPAAKTTSSPTINDSSAVEIFSDLHNNAGADNNSEPIGRLETAPDGTVYRLVKILPGDNLEKLLRREGMDASLIYSHLLKLVLTLNPEVKNPDLIFAGAELKIPAAGSYLAKYGVSDNLAKTAMSQPAATSAIQLNNPPLGATQIPDLPNLDLDLRQKSLMAIFNQLGAVIENGPPHQLEINGQIFVLDTKKFPVLDLLNGRAVILDLDGQLPNNLAQLFTTAGYVTLRLNTKDSLAQNLEKIWPYCNFYKVYNHKQSYEGGSNLKLKITASWLIWPGEQDWLAGRPKVINLSSQKTPLPWQSFLEQHGLKVIDLSPAGEILSSAPKNLTQNLKLLNINAKNPSFLTAALITQLGGAAKIGVQLDLAQNQAEILESGKLAPVLWDDDDHKMVFIFEEMPQETLKVLEDINYQVILSSPAPEEVLKTILSSTQTSFSQNLILENKGPGPKALLTIPGLSFVWQKQKYFFTAVTPPAGLVDLGLDPATIILKY